MDGHGNRTHGRFSPSQADRFFVCKGSTALLATVSERQESPYALEGTTAHEVLEAALANGIWTAREAHHESIHFAVELDKLYGGDYEDFYMSIDIALQYIKSLVEEYPGAQVFIERKVMVPSAVAPGEADGHCDIIVWHPLTGVLFVIDYKHGAGVAKEADCRQLKQYGAGVVHGPNGIVEELYVNEMFLVIVQPRAYHPAGAIREVPVATFELYGYLEEMDEAIADNLEAGAPLVPDDNGKTTDHCRFCDARSVCPARVEKALKPLAAVSSKLITLEAATKPRLPSIRSLTIDQLGAIRANKKLLEKWLKDVDDHVYELMRQGHAVPGAKLVEARPQREYYGDEKEIAKKAAALCGKSEDEMYTPRKLLPLTQVETQIVEAFKARVGRGKKNKAAETARSLFAELTLKKSSGNLVIADEDDPRQAVQGKTDSLKGIGALIEQPKID